MIATRHCAPISNSTDDNSDSNAVEHFLPFVLAEQFIVGIPGPILKRVGPFSHAACAHLCFAFGPRFSFVFRSSHVKTFWALFVYFNSLRESPSLG